PAQVEVVRGACTDCPEQTQAGAPAGAPCASHAVCQQHCCGCGGKPLHYLVKGCVDGKCAGRDEACGLRIAEAKVCE
ncbi:MAG TPA: hypothetical protein VK524_13965, partial [Polyangiaceae bacterium]|nr:hypothetical protein [Polyangiaceae bacterium]